MRRILLGGAAAFALVCSLAACGQKTQSNAAVDTTLGGSGAPAASVSSAEPDSTAPSASSANVSATAASGPAADPTLFSCQTTSGKLALFIDAGSVVKYSYGKAGSTPDVALSVPKANVYKHIDCGMMDKCVSEIFFHAPNGMTYSGHDFGHVQTTGEHSYLTVSSAGKRVAKTNCVGAAVVNIDVNDATIADSTEDSDDN